MKTNLKIAQKLSAGFSFLLIAAFGFIISCQKDDVKPGNVITSDDQYLEKDLSGTLRVCGPVIYKTLALEDGTKVGDVQIYNDANYLYVSAKTLARYTFGDAYLYVGDVKRLPMSLDGEILYQKFKFIHRVNSNDLENSHYFKIPLSTISSKNSIALNIQVFSLDTFYNAWATGKLEIGQHHPEVFPFDRTYCDDELLIIE